MLSDIICLITMKSQYQVIAQANLSMHVCVGGEGREGCVCVRGEGVQTYVHAFMHASLCVFLCLWMSMNV